MSHYFNSYKLFLIFFIIFLFGLLVFVFNYDDRNSRIIYIAVNGLDFNFFVKNKKELPNLGEMEYQKLTMPYPMDPIASFYTLATGKIQDTLWPSYGNNEIDWEKIENFEEETFWAKAKTQEKKVFISESVLDWSREYNVLSKDLEISSFVAENKDYFKKQNEEILSVIDSNSYDIVISKIDIVNNLSHLYKGEELLKIYKDIDQFIGSLKNSLKEDELLIVVSAHGQGEVETLFSLNQELINKGFAGFDKNSLLLSSSYAYSLIPGTISINVDDNDELGLVKPNQIQGITDDIIFSTQTLDDMTNNRLVQIKFHKLSNNKHIVLGLPASYGINWKEDLEKGKYSFTKNTSHIVRDYWGKDPETIPGILFSSEKISPDINFLNLNSEIFKFKS